MTELDHLRKLLDEAGVSYLNHRGDITIGYYTDDPHSVIEAMDHSLQVTGLTAEQAMRALGHSSNCTNSERTSDELLPCPFCGGKAEIVHTPKVIPYEPRWIRCSLCEVTTPKYKSETAKTDAIAAWNRRAEHD